MTRVQKERFTDAEEYERLKGFYVVNKDFIMSAKHGITIMHPLPRLAMKLRGKSMNMKALPISARLPTAFRSAWRSLPW